MPFSQKIKEEALVKSHRYCCVCHEFHGRDVNIHHIQQEAEGGANVLENAIVLCLKCHSEAGHYNPSHPLGKKYSPRELKKHRDQWWKLCETSPPGKIKKVTDGLKDLSKKALLAAEILVSNAKERWNFPSFSSTIRMELKEKRKDETETFTPLDMKQLISYSKERNHLFIFGAAGIGKTTVLLSLCEKLLNESNSPIPFFIDASTWASSNKTMLEYLESFPVFLDAGINIKKLSSLIENGKILIAINGWNEIGADLKVTARDRLQHFLAGTRSATTIISARFSNEIVGVHNTKRIAIRGFDWDDQKLFVLKSLPSENADSLINRLRVDKKLRAVTKNPFVLNGVVALQRSGKTIPDNQFDLLKAIVDLFEAEPIRVNILRSSPLLGCHQDYLIDLSEEMNNFSSTIISEKSARKIIQITSSKLKKEGVLSNKPESADILEILCDYHLLYRKEDSTIRFAHQRFQEFFSAKAILKKLKNIFGKDEEIEAFQLKILNCPFWTDALEISVSKLANNKGLQHQADFLVSLSIPIDLFYSSELFGMLGFGCNELSSFQKLESQINFLHKQTFKEPKNYSLHCAAATRSISFSNFIWPLIEDEDRDIRYNGFELAGGIRIDQLGPGAEERIMKWPDERRKSAIYSLADLDENKDFIETLAFTDPIAAVRAEAIHILGFYHWSIGQTTTAWLKAPDPVKEEHNALSSVLEFWNPSNNVLTTELISLADRSKNDSTKREIGLAIFKHPNKISDEEINKELMRQDYKNRDTNVFVKYLKERDPAKIKTIVHSAILKGQRFEKWMYTECNSYSENIKDELASSLLNKLSKKDNIRLSSVFAKTATTKFIEKLIDEGLSLSSISFEELRENKDKELRLRAIEKYLHHVKKTTFVKVSTPKLNFCNYSQTDWILNSFDRDDRCANEVSYPDIIEDNVQIDDFDLFIKAAVCKKDSEKISSCRLEARIATITSRYYPNYYRETILEMTRRHILAYSIYEAELSKWVKKSKQSNRPSNPPYQSYFVRSLIRCGTDILPDLFKMAESSGNTELIYISLCTIVNEPWSKKIKTNYSFRTDYIRRHFKHREMGRVFLQPDDYLQEDADKVATLLSNEIQMLISKKNNPENSDEKTQSKLTYSINGLGIHLSRVPSRIGLPILHLVLNNKSSRIYNYIDIAHLFIGQGEKLSKESRETIKILWQKEMDKKWHSSNETHLFTDLALLHFFIKPIEQGLKQLRELLPQWVEKVSFYSIVEEVGHVHTEEGINFLVDLLSHDKMNDELKKRIFYSIYKNPVPMALETLIRFFDLEIMGNRYMPSEFFGNSIGKRFKKEAYKKTDLYSRLVAILESKNDPKHEAMVCTVLSESYDSRIFKLIYRYLNEELYPHGGKFAKDLIISFFSLKVESEYGENSYEVHPKANNEIRKHLFDLASTNSPFRNRARSILMSLEEMRMKNGRPVEENRHPNFKQGNSWPAILYDIPI